MPERLWGFIDVQRTNLQWAIVDENGVEQSSGCMSVTRDLATQLGMLVDFLTACFHGCEIGINAAWGPMCRVIKAFCEKQSHCIAVYPRCDRPSVMRENYVLLNSNDTDSALDRAQLLAQFLRFVPQKVVHIGDCRRMAPRSAWGDQRKVWVPRSNMIAIWSYLKDDCWECVGLEPLVPNAQSDGEPNPSHDTVNPIGS